MGPNQTTGIYICTDGAKPAASIQNGKPTQACDRPAAPTEQEKSFVDLVKDGYRDGMTMRMQAEQGMPQVTYGAASEIARSTAETIKGTLETLDTLFKNPPQVIAGSITGYAENIGRLWNTVTHPGEAWNAFREQVADAAAQAGPEGVGKTIVLPLTAAVGMLRPKGAAGLSDALHHPPHPPHEKPPKAPHNKELRVEPKRMKAHKPKCFKPGKDLKKNWKGDPNKLEKEFYRQLKDQEAGLNNMTVKDYLDNRAQYDQIQRMGTGAAQEKARAGLADKIKKSVTDSLISKGVPDAQMDGLAAQQTKEIMGSLAALHNPDLKAGGADVIGRVGDASVNSSIGSQWAKADRIPEMDQAARDALAEQGPDAKMNVQLERCKN